MPMTSKTTNKSQISDGEYEEFLRGLSLKAVGLKRCSASLDRAALYELWETKKTPVRDFKDTYRVTEVAADFFEVSGLFLVTVRESGDSEPVVTIECEFEAHLHATEPIPRVFVDRFVKSALQLILVPYARPFVSSITAQMSIPPLIIPLSIRSTEDASGASKKQSKEPRPGTHAKAR